MGNYLMSLLKLYTYKSNFLRNKSSEVQKINAEIELLVSNMVETLHSKPGLGLAAPQVGRNLRIIVIESRGLKDDDGNIIYEHIPLKILINPKILSHSKEKIEMEEGCFSVPNIFGPVLRPKKIKAIATNIKGKSFKLNASGLLARVIQHEIDHLDAILFIDKAKNIHKVENV